MRLDGCNHSYPPWCLNCGNPCRYDGNLFIEILYPEIKLDKWFFHNERETKHLKPCEDDCSLKLILLIVTLPQDTIPIHAQVV